MRLRDLKCLHSILLFPFRFFFYENKLVFSVLGNQPLHDRKHIYILYSLDKDQRHLRLNYTCVCNTAVQHWHMLTKMTDFCTVNAYVPSPWSISKWTTGTLDDAMMKLNFRSKKNNSTSSARAKYKSCLTRWRWLTAEASSSTSRYFMVKSTEKELYWFCAKHSPTLKSNTKTTQQTSAALISTQEVDR